MASPGSFELVVAAPASVRLEAARSTIRAHAATGLLVVGASRAAADELVLHVARAEGALADVSRASFAELATKLALPLLAERLVAPASALGTEAMVARASFDAAASGELAYLGPVATLPGFPRAAARTLGELQQAGITSDRVAAVERVGPDLAALAGRLAEQAARSGATGRADVMATAASRLEASPDALPSRHVLLCDIAVTTAAERRLLQALVAAAASVLAVVPDGDTATIAACRGLGAVERPSTPPSATAGAAPAGTARDRLQAWLFAADAPPVGDLDDTVQIFSAPGEGREAIEIARRVLLEADRGVPFDEMAVLLRAPQTYLGLLEHAFARAGVPAWFERGTRRPDPAGRAFLALLACADEGLSARRFAEYLSLGQVPASATEASAAPDRGAAGVAVTTDDADRVEVTTDDADRVAVTTDDAAGALVPPEDLPEDPAPLEEAPSPGERDGDAIVAGTLRAPWRWEELLVEAYVIEGLDRWQRRLPGLRHEYDRRWRELADEDRDSPRLVALERDREQLGYLEAFALPIVTVLDTWREARTWADWLRDFATLVPRVLRQPARVSRVLAELMPLGAVGPVPLREVRDVLTPRLLTLTNEPPRRRHGRVFVGTPQAARARTFAVVFVPGLAERVFPQRLREDALLLDARRAALDPALPVADTRADDERLYLRLAVGAATDRVHLSYPRLELAESRPRVPSFYVLDVMRATTGTIPRYSTLADHAFEQGRASLAWPAPPDPRHAIDDMEHDLAMLLPLLRAPAAENAAHEGRARYLLELNAALHRSVRERWMRWQPRWSPADGITRVQPLTAPALAAERLTARPYSLTALQRFSACPYQFQLAAIYRLAPLETPAPLQRLDPLTRGSLFHEIQTEFFRTLVKNHMLPLAPGHTDTAKRQLEWAITQVTTAAYDKLAPAIDRVWNDEVARLRRDLGLWFDEMVVKDAADWVPDRFELAFGLPPDSARDEHSVTSPVSVGAAGFRLRGSIDLVERRKDGKVLRVTDHKTGRNRTTPATIVEGGRILQPVLYAVALEALSGEPVAEGRLSYCTTAGQFTTRTIAIDEPIRRRGLEVLEIVDRAVEQGTLAAKPGRLGEHHACDYCDFRPVCGPNEPSRTGRKPAVADLDALRRMP
ncbi:MAG: PD-(D/E)XK nuclease family protein [Vicinamibacterales bacterium]